MIRGPIVPLTRDGLWRLVVQKPEMIERGLGLVAESLELGIGRAGHVDGLLRDAIGRPVLAFATDERDEALAVRVYSAHSFWRRNATGLLRSLPEADLRDGTVCRVIVIGVSIGDETVATIERLGIDGLELYEVEAFAIAGQERLAVRQRLGTVRSGGPQPLDAAIAPAPRGHVDAFVGMLQALDPRVRIDGDRYSRRVTLAGRLLGECWVASDLAHAGAAGVTPRALQGSADVRAVVDQIARRYLGEAEGAESPGRESAGAPSREVELMTSARSALDSLRASVSTSRLSREECAALGEGQDPGDLPEERLAEK